MSNELPAARESKSQDLLASHSMQRMHQPLREHNIVVNYNLFGPKLKSLQLQGSKIGNHNY